VRKKKLAVKRKGVANEILTKRVFGLLELESKIIGAENVDDIMPKFKDSLNERKILRIAGEV
jgi:hypothetical protein